MSVDNDNREIDLFHVWRVLWDAKRLIVPLFLAAVVTAGVVTCFLLPKKYQSSVTFYLQGQSSAGGLAALANQLGGSGLLTEGAGGTKADLASEIVLARRSLEAVLRARGLSHGPEDVRRFAKSVRVETRKSGAIRISVLWTDPRVACALTSEVFANYRRVVEDEIHGTIGSNRRFLEEQFAKAGERVAAAEDALVRFQKQEGILLLPDQATESIKQFGELERQRVEAGIGDEEARSRLAKAGKLLDAESPRVKAAVTETLNPLLQGYKADLTRVEIALADARVKYTDKHPTVKGLLTQREELTAKMAAEMEYIVASETVSANPVHQALAGNYLQDQVELAGLESRQAALDTVYARYDRELSHLPGEMLAYGRLVREQKVAGEIYVLLTSQLEQTKITEAREESVRIQVIDPPVVPDRKYSPSIRLNVAVAGFLALMAGVVLAFARDYMMSARRGGRTVAG